jgi:hypothetical protein
MSDAELGILHSNWRGMDTTLLVSIFAEKAIEAARETLAGNPYTEGFGSLRYEVSSLLEAKGCYDAVFVSGVLHHLPDVNRAVCERLSTLLG